MAILLEKGEQITCINGHVICEASVDIERGSQQNTKQQLTNWQQPEPKPGAQLPLYCEVCGGIWATDYRDGIHVFTARGWR